MAAAVMPLAVFVMAAVGLCGVDQLILEQSLHRCIRIPGHTAEQTDARPVQGILCTAADTAADQYIHAAAK